MCVCVWRGGGGGCWLYFVFLNKMSTVAALRVSLRDHGMFESIKTEFQT